MLRHARHDRPSFFGNRAAASLPPAFLFIALTLPASSLMRAQQPAPSITLSGTVQTAEGKPLGAARLELRRGKVVVSARSAADGQFKLAVSAAGRYTLAVTPGKGITARLGVTLKAGEPAYLCLRFDVAANTLQEAPCSATTGASASGQQGGQELTGKQVSSLPLNGRDFSQLLHLVAGTMTDTNGAANFTQQFAVNGQRGTTAVFAMDGFFSSDPEMGGATFDNFNVDAIEEVRSSTGVMPAETGEGAASFTDVITKSGADQVHGDAFEFVRNSAFDARNFFDRRTLVSPGRLPQFERNEFGVTNGGPVVLPHIYDGQGRTYYFVEYQGFRQLLGTTQILAVPTAQERQGVDTTAFPGDTLQVPVSPAIAPVLAKYPLPNDVGGPYGLRTFATSAPVVTNSDQFSVRIDHKISDKSQLYGRFSMDDITGPLTNPDQTAIDPSFAVRFFDNEINTGLSYTRTLSPNLTWQTHVSFIRATPFFPSINTTQPSLVFGDSIFEPFNTPGGSIMGSYGNLAQLRQDWVDVHGPHTWKFGGEFRVNLDTTIFGINPNGQFTFGGGPAYAPVPIPSASGLHNIGVGQLLPDALTGFLTGTPYSYGSAVAYTLFPQGNHIGESAIHRQAYNFYLQDTWKATHNLTVDYGLRYEVETPIYETHHLTSAPRFVGPNGLPSTSWAPGASQQLLYYPQPSYGTTWTGWGPRLSLTYHVSDHTMVHAGGAITTLLNNLWQDNFMTGGFPIVLNPFFSASPGAPVPFANATLNFNLPPLYTPQGGLVFATGSSAAVPANTPMDMLRFEQNLAAATPGGQPHPLAINGMASNFRDGYIGTYTAGVEHDFGSVTLDADYVATSGISLPSVIFPNAYGGASQGFAPFTAFDSTGQAVGGYGPESIMTSRSHSYYHSLQTSLSKTSPSLGLGFQVSYTYSKAIDDSSAVLAGFSGAALGTVLQAFPQNPYNPGAELGPSTFDLTHVLAFSVIQELPFNRIQALRPLGRKVTGGWELLSVSTLTSGPPFSIFSGIQQTGYGTSNADRPDQIGQPALSTSGVIREDYFGQGANNASLFYIPIGIPGGTGPNQGRFGTLGRNTFRGPGYQDYDFGLIKDTPLGTRSGREAAMLEFRAEFFNLMNLTNFAIPANVVRGTGFGMINHTAGPSRQLQFSLKVIY